jgi:hypothetical protein
MDAAGLGWASHATAVFTFVSVASLFSCQLRRKGALNVDPDPPAADARRHAESPKT